MFSFPILTCRLGAGGGGGPSEGAHAHWLPAALRGSLGRGRGAAAIHRVIVLKVLVWEGGESRGHVTAQGETKTSVFFFFAFSCFFLFCPPPHAPFSSHNSHSCISGVGAADGERGQRHKGATSGGQQLVQCSQ